MIVGLGDARDVERIDFEDEIIKGKPAAKTKAKPKPKAIAKVVAAVLPTSPPPFVPQAPASTIFGLPKTTVYIALATLLAAGGYLMLSRSGRRVANPRSRERRVSNPRGGRSIEKAKRFREDFHWGLPTNSIVKRKVSKQPRVAVKLGELHSVTYRTKKNGEKVELFEHTFEGRRPWLGMDIDNKRLHLLGGSYTVTADGITG